MDQKNLTGLFMGMVIGAAIVLLTLFLNARLSRVQPTIEQASQFLIEKEAESPLPAELPPNAGKDLCVVLPQEEVNRLVPSAEIRSIERSPIIPFSNCAYFGDRRSVPVLSFNHNLPNLAQLKEVQKKGGASVRDLSGVGDEAFFANIPSLPGSGLNLRAIFFRVGSLGYSMSSFDLSENQLRVLVNAVIPKLR
jgi:hypothetical protein